MQYVPELGKRGQRSGRSSWQLWPGGQPEGWRGLSVDSRIRWKVDSDTDYRNSASGAWGLAKTGSQTLKHKRGSVGIKLGVR